jgi:uncharacterized protein (TIGR04255 family)
MIKNIRTLSLPQAERVRFERNTIRQVFCELRFPTLPDLENDLPRDFLKSIGKEYPVYEHGMGLKIGITDKGMEQIPQGTHRLHSRKRDRTAWVRSSSFGVETRDYLDFETFHTQIITVMDGLTPHLDTDFFTRVGLRYLNVFPTDPNDITDWVNEALLGPFATDVLGGGCPTLVRDSGTNRIRRLYSSSRCRRYRRRGSQVYFGYRFLQ